MNQASIALAIRSHAANPRHGFDQEVLSHAVKLSAKNADPRDIAIGFQEPTSSTHRIAKVAKIPMPRGSRPGERRGGRQKGTPNKSTVLKKAALSAASADPTITPLQFLLGVMRDPQVPTDLRIRVARAAAPLVHGKPGIASREVGKAGAIDGFAIDIEEAKSRC
jgi:hypothetical protein